MSAKSTDIRVVVEEFFEKESELSAATFTADAVGTTATTNEIATVDSTKLFVNLLRNMFFLMLRLDP